MEITDKGYNSYKYCEVWKVVERRDNAVFKTKSIGFIRADNKKFSNDLDYILSPLSTSFTASNTFTIKLIE